MNKPTLQLSDLPKPMTTVNLFNGVLYTWEDSIGNRLTYRVWDEGQGSTWRMTHVKCSADYIAGTSTSDDTVPEWVYNFAHRFFE